MKKKTKQNKKKPVENFPGCSAYAGAYHLTFRRAALKRGDWEGGWVIWLGHEHFPNPISS